MPPRARSRRGHRPGSRRRSAASPPGVGGISSAASASSAAILGERASALADQPARSRILVRRWRSRAPPRQHLAEQRRFLGAADEQRRTGGGGGAGKRSISARQSWWWTIGRGGGAAGSGERLAVERHRPFAIADQELPAAELHRLLAAAATLGATPGKMCNIALGWSSRPRSPKIKREGTPDALDSAGPCRPDPARCAGARLRQLRAGAQRHHRRLHDGAPSRPKSTPRSPTSSSRPTELCKGGASSGRGDRPAARRPHDDRRMSRRRVAHGQRERLRVGVVLERRHICASLAGLRLDRRGGGARRARHRSATPAGRGRGLGPRYHYGDARDRALPARNRGLSLQPVRRRRRWSTCCGATPTKIPSGWPEPFHVTVCPYEAQDYLDGGDVVVEGVRDARCGGPLAAAPMSRAITSTSPSRSAGAAPDDAPGAERGG